MAGFTPEEAAAIKQQEIEDILRFGRASDETRKQLMDLSVGVKGTTEGLTRNFKALGTSGISLAKELNAGVVGASVFNDSIGSVSNALGDLVGLIPYVGGALKTLVKGASEYTQAVNKQADQLYSTYKQMGAIGAAGAGGMQSVYDNLKKLNLGVNELSDFASLVGENAQTLASFGKTVGSGLDEFANISNAIQQSDVGAEFRDMGISVMEINKGIAGYTKMQNLVGGRQKMTTDQLIAASQDYIREVDLLAKITGKNRAEQEASKESAMAEERYAAYKYELDQRAKMGDEAAKAQLATVEGTQIMLDKMAPETRKGFLNILSGTLDTPEAAKLLMTMPNAAAIAGKQTFTQAEFQAAALKDITSNLQGGGLQLAKMGSNNDTFLSIQEQMKLKAHLEGATYDERLAAAKTGQKLTDQATKNMGKIEDANRTSRDNLNDLVNAGIEPVTAGMKGLANATDATITAMTKMAGMAGVTVKKRDAAPAAASAPPAAPTPSGAAPRANISGQLKDDLLSRLSSSGITDKKAQANVLAQFDAESGGNTGAQEKLGYSAKRLLEVFPKKFKDLQDAESVASAGQEAIGNRIYGGRMGNAADEGFKYRGRGLVQLTGKDNYKKFGELLGIDLVKDPDLAATPEIAKAIAVEYVKQKQQSGTDLTNIADLGKAIGYAGGQAETAKRANIATAYMAGGGVIKATPGGVDLVAGEAGQNEAIVPLPDGRSIPVQMQGADQQTGIMAEQLARLDDIMRVLQNQLGVSEKILKYAQ
jgi:predicted chitinase